MFSYDTSDQQRIWKKKSEIYLNLVSWITQYCTLVLYGDGQYGWSGQSFHELLIGAQAKDWNGDFWNRRKSNRRLLSSLSFGVDFKDTSTSALESGLADSVHTRVIHHNQHRSFGTASPWKAICREYRHSSGVLEMSKNTVTYFMPHGLPADRYRKWLLSPALSEPKIVECLWLL